MYRILVSSCLSLFVLFTTTSCSGTKVIRPPSVDPAAAAAAAVKQYDTNTDGKLGEAELDKSALSIKLWDADGDGGVVADEISSRITQFTDSGVGLVRTRCDVLWNGAPLNGATVVFEPESFLGGGVQPATGTTDASGTAMMSVADEFLPAANVKGIQPGVYLVRITHPEIALPELYNTYTTLTYECSPINELPAPKFELSKR